MPAVVPVVVPEVRVARILVLLAQQLQPRLCAPTSSLPWKKWSALWKKAARSTAPKAKQEQALE